MATTVRKTRVINGKPRNNWSAKQIRAGFAGKRRQLAAKRRKNARPAGRSAKPAARRNISGIAVAGLPNPATRRNTMPKTKKNATARRKNFKGSVARRNKPKTNRHKSHGHRTRKNSTTIVKYMPAPMAKQNPHRKGKRRGNPGGESTTSLIQTSLFGAAGAVGSRLIPQWVLGTANSSWTGYGANIVAGLGLAWLGRKFVGPKAGGAILGGAGIALVLRLIQDFTPWGSVATLSGVRGDVGMGALLPQSFVDPAIYTGNGAQLRIPPAWQPPPAAAAVATKGVSGIPSTYGFSTYGR
jgi:hypothetical protein